jgi:uncharacterized membrane-anchored protein YitT (DUF2179 family)
MQSANVVPLKRGRVLRAERKKAQAKEHGQRGRFTSERIMAKSDHFSMFVAGLVGGLIGGLSVALVVMAHGAAAGM